MLPENATICVLISGQMRNFEWPLESLKVALAKFQPTYFVSTWKKRGSKVIGAWHFDQLQRLMPLKIVRIFPYAFMQPEPFSGIPALRRLLVDRNTYSEDISCDIIRNIIPDAIIKIDPDNLLDYKLKSIKFREPNAYRMLYKLNQCAEMMYEFEITNEMSFKYFLRVRPDMLIPETLLDTINFLDETEIFTDNANEDERTTGDSLAWGHRSDLGAYLALADRLDKNLANQTYLDAWRNIHYELFDAISLEKRKLRNANPSGHILEERISQEDLIKSAEKSMDEVDAARKEELKCFMHLLLGIEALEEHDYLSAQRQAQAAIGLRSDSATAFHLLAQAQNGLGNIIGAFESAAMSVGFSSNFWGDDYLSDYFSDLIKSFPNKELAMSSIEKAFHFAKNAERLRAQMHLANKNDFNA